MNFFSVDVKAVFDCQPLLVTGPLPYWLRNLAHSWVMIALDTFQDNLCLRCCIAVHCAVRPDPSTQVARRLAESFFKLLTGSNDCPWSSLGELDRVGKHLNQGVVFSDWLGIQVYEPEREEDGEVVWHL